MNCVSLLCSGITLADFYHIDETEAEREKKRLERAKRRALSSSVIRELKEQYSDAPEEIRDARHPHVTRQSQEDQHRSESLQLEIVCYAVETCPFALNDDDQVLIPREPTLSRKWSAKFGVTVSKS